MVDTTTDPGTAIRRADRTYALERNIRLWSGVILFARGSFNEVTMVGRNLYGLTAEQVGTVGNSLVSSRQSVDRKKQLRLSRAAGIFLGKNPEFGARACRFDVVAIDQGPATKLCWVRNAFDSALG